MATAVRHGDRQGRHYYIRKTYKQRCIVVATLAVAMLHASDFRKGLFKLHFYIPLQTIAQLLQAFQQIFVSYYFSFTDIFAGNGYLCLERFDVVYDGAGASDTLIRCQQLFGLALLVLPDLCNGGQRVEFSILL